MLHTVFYFLLGCGVTVLVVMAMSWWGHRNDKLAKAEDLIVKLHSQAQDAQMARIGPPKLQTGFAIPLIFHRERFECHEDRWYGRWSVVPDYGRRWNDHYSDLPKRNGFYVRITDEYKAHTIRVAWNHVQADEEFRIDLPSQNPAVTSDSRDMYPALDPRFRQITAMREVEEHWRGIA